MTAHELQLAREMYASKRDSAPEAVDLPREDFAAHSPLHLALYATTSPQFTADKPEVNGAV
jgi:hypothetical protein